MTEETDDALIALARTGNRKAFDALIDRHYGTIHRIAWRHCRDSTDAEDIAQDVCVRIARSIGQFEGRSSFSTWYHGITVNAVRDAMRAKARRGAALIAMGALVPATPDERHDPGDEDLRLWDAVRALPERQREAVQLVYVDGLSHKEAARMIGCAEATVSWHLFAARRTLKTTLAGIER